MEQFKINILSPGRFHVLDLARELAAQGFDVKFYSFVPTSRAEKYGLKRENSRSLLFLMLPFLALQKIFHKQDYFKMLTVLVQDFLTGILMRKADIVIAMSGNYVYSLKKAKNFDAKIIVERGSKHILEQKRILDEITKNNSTSLVPDFNIKRELISYSLADYIAVASSHVLKSFEKHSYPKNKLFVNPYGVDLAAFYPDNPIKDKVFDLIFVGGWSYRKGCDVLINAVENLNVSCLHVGSIVDIPFPSGDLFTHVDSLDQNELVHYYHKAKIFILPSREEGLAMVQLQAVACNLPLVCSEHSGGEDIKKILENTESIFVINDPLSVSSVENAIEDALRFEQENANKEHYDMDKLGLLTWKAYGKRYGQFLNKAF